MLTHFLSSRILPMAYLHCLPNNHDVYSLYENQEEVLYLKFKNTHMWILKDPGKIDNCSTTGPLCSYGCVTMKVQISVGNQEFFFSVKICLNLKTNLGILWFSWNSLTCDYVITINGMFLCPVISRKKWKDRGYDVAESTGSHVSDHTRQLPPLEPSESLPVGHRSHGKINNHRNGLI